MGSAFITGINGFIGSHLAAFLLSRGDEVIGLVRPTSDLRSLKARFEEFGERFRLVVGDLRHEPSLEAALAQVDTVYHLAAVVMGTSEAAFRASIVLGTKNLLEAVQRQRGPGFRRFLYVSSQAAAGPSPTSAPIDESRASAPVSRYGRSKSEAEGIVHEYGQRGLPVTIVRPVGVYGEREQDLSRGTFPAVGLGLSPRIGLTGEKTVSLIYVGDLVRGIVAAAESEKSIGRTYFLADPEPYSSTRFIGAIADAMKTSVRIPIVVPHVFLRLGAILAELISTFTRSRPLLTRDKVREVSQRHWAASAVAADRDFGWKATVSLSDGLSRAVADWRQRVRDQNAVLLEPRRDRAMKTYSLALGFGLLVEGTSHLARWYEFNPEWFIVVAILGFFGVILGTVSFFTAACSSLVQFLAGAIVFVAVEVSNHEWLHLWEFADEPFGRLDPWIRAIVLAIPIGLVPVGINALIRLLYRLRLRLG